MNWKGPVCIIKGQWRPDGRLVTVICAIAVASGSAMGYAMADIRQHRMFTISEQSEVA